jgi:hypothetical protein
VVILVAEDIVDVSFVEEIIEFLGVSIEVSVSQILWEDSLASEFT